MIILILILSILIIYNLFIFNIYKIQKKSYNWKKVLTKNWIEIRNECINLVKNIPKTNKNRNKYWDEIDKTYIKNKWILGHESIDNTWLNYGLIVENDLIDSNCDSCPKTTNILNELIKNGIKIKVA